MVDELLIKWCDSIVRYQGRDMADARLNGGIYCPACMRIHGRSGDALLPLMQCHRIKGDIKYYNAAERLFDWSEHMVRPDNSYNNDTNSPWNGITVFASIQMGETLLHFKDLLGAGFEAKLRRRFINSVRYLYKNIWEIGGNINYPITCSYAMALADKILGSSGEYNYMSRAKELACFSLEHITEDGLIYGEGHPMDAVTAKGCRPVDLGYNVEESLPSLVQYAALTGDDELMKRLEKIAMAHLDFILPDGGLDNSFGSRSYKWSYWGSRTSDGCALGFMLLAKRNRTFGKAALRNLELLSSCTGRNGLLAGGSMYEYAEEPSCIHHTICHAKVLALLSINKFDEAAGKEGYINAVLPSEERMSGSEINLKRYPSIETCVMSGKDWRLTATGYDYEYTKGSHATGGSISLLWRSEWGVVLSGGMPDYRLVEPNNMQLPKVLRDIELTPRFEVKKEKDIFSSSRDLSASMNAEAARIISIGHIANTENDASLGAYKLEYAIDDGGFMIYGETAEDDAEFILPVVLRKNAKAKVYNDRVILDGGSHKLEVVISGSAFETGDNFVFNPVGGFAALKIIIKKPVQFNVRIACARK